MRLSFYSGLVIAATLAGDHTILALTLKEKPDGNIEFGQVNAEADVEFGGRVRSAAKRGGNYAKKGANAVFGSGSSSNGRNGNNKNGKNGNNN